MESFAIANRGKDDSVFAIILEVIHLHRYQTMRIDVHKYR